jgi:hypothetical protein
MSTRSYIILKKGNEYRAIFVHWDGNNHGDTFRKLTNPEIAELWTKIRMAAEKDGGAWLDHFYTYKAWIARIAREIEFEKDDSDHLDQYLQIIFSPQMTAHDPVFPRRDNYKTTDEYVSCAVFNAKDKGKTLHELLHNGANVRGKNAKKLTKPLDLMCVEMVWLFDIETNQVFIAPAETNEWKEQKPRTRKS